MDAFAATAVAHPLYVILLLVAVVLLVLAAAGRPATKISLGWLGLACWALMVLLTLLGWG